MGENIVAAANSSATFFLFISISLVSGLLP